MVMKLESLSANVKNAATAAFTVGKVTTRKTADQALELELELEWNFKRNWK